jgi:hypothetical protein
MLTSEFNNFSRPNIRWLYNFSDETLRAWKFRPSQIKHISRFGNSIGLNVIPQSFIESYNYTNSGLSWYLAPLRNESNNSSTHIEAPDIIQESNHSNDIEEEIVSNSEVLNIIIESAHDLQIKYLNTYGLKDGIPIYIIDIENSSKESTHCIKYYTINDHLILDTKCSFNIGEFDMTLPKIGMINTDKAVVLVERKHKRSSPARYRKGIRPDTLVMTSLSHNSIVELGISDLYDTHYYGDEAVFRLLLKDIFFPKKVSYKEALNLVSSGEKISCAFSQSLAIGACFITNKIYLYKNQWILGTFNPKKKLFLLDNNYFSSELDKYGVKYEPE